MLKILIGASSSKIFHLKEFSKKLEEHDVKVKVVLDVDYAVGFPNRKILKWFSSNKKFKELVSEFKPDVICHLAAQAGVRYSLENPKSYIDNNVVATTNLLEIAKDYNVNNFIDKHIIFLYFSLNISN